MMVLLPGCWKFHARWSNPDSELLKSNGKPWTTGLRVTCSLPHEPGTCLPDSPVRKPVLLSLCKSDILPRGF